MDLNRIAVYAQVVEEGSFTAAAKVRGVRKSSVSRAVAALEADLGIRLLQRTTRKLSVTDAGRAYYERARDALAGLEEGRQAVAALGAEPRGRVRVTAPVDLAGDLAAATAAFLRDNAQVQVDVLLTARYVDLVQEGFDLAVRAGVLADTSLLARKLGVSDLGLFASPAYLARAGRPRKPADLTSHECVLYRAAEGNATWKLSGPGGQVEVTVRGRATTDERAFVRGMLLADFGIGLVPVPLVSALVKAGQLERVLPRWASRGAPLHLVWPSRRFEPIAVARYREALAEALPRALGAELRR